MENIKLTKEELNELIGGQRVEVLQPDEPTNSNAIIGCCEPINFPGNNQNSAHGCYCNCQ
ncbi:MAG: hypothetical protein LBE13_08270 [Bacteroidales bacterium]|jgi:hypothetical protein|nr:hypothetical protein [Bacteroidales bacterium]